MYLHILSDLHLEHYNKSITFDDLLKLYPHFYNEITQPLNECILILSGDIGSPFIENYWSFINHCSNKYKHVILITGNHEYHVDFHINETGYEYIKFIDNIIEHKVKHDYNNVHFLNNNFVMIDNIKFIGTTLWTNIVGKYRMSIQSSLSDYMFINGFNVDIVNDLHKNAIEYINKQLTLNDCISNVIITHHLPSKKLIAQQYQNNLYEALNHAYYTDLEYLISDKIKLWVCGHTHIKQDLHIDTTRVVVNPVGYKNEFNDFKLLEIEIN